ncbi:MAG: ABC transporter ATP-binding protein [Rhizobiales bacterium]|nr:ABC transporter ATP-binding protein [Hyphomicrobiales bacterium]
MAAALEVRGIVKRYGALVANAGVDLVVERGEIHGIMGENGAGKSTLMNILYGVTQPDAGEIRLGGELVRLRSPLDAIRNGLGMVHQAFRLFDSLSVWENIVFGREPVRGWVVDGRTARATVAELAERFSLSVNVDARVGDLSVGVRQRVEILKALYREARILILDEPTAVLTPREADALADVMRALVADGRSILFVTHKLREVLDVTDRITVMRHGAVSARLETARTSEQEVVRAMVGRAVSLDIQRPDVATGDVILEVDRLSVKVEHGHSAVSDAGLTVRAGEIVGIAGVAGNGQSELIEAIAGLRRHAGGTIRLRGTEIGGLSVGARRRLGFAYIPEDRATVGTAGRASAAENLILGFQRRREFQRWGHLLHARVLSWAQRLIVRYDVRIRDAQTPVDTLSGGNLQKVVVARELEHQAALIIAEQPTRGVDIGAIEFIHRKLLEERARGRAILLVSAELSEILALSDRILVIYEGRIVANLPSREASEERIGSLLAGGSGDAPPLEAGALPTPSPAPSLSDATLRDP